ncbi:MAG: DMT family transporter [Clostridia bacterium]|jgi:drug/metabolite transporter (DMT)-like permease|nr:DMT family transporter [Clostridia bacterium]
MKTKSKIKMAKIMLFLTAVIWGSSLCVIKSSIDSIGPMYIIALRFSIAVVILAAIFRKKLKLLDKDYLKSGLIVGICLFLAYSSQTIGVAFNMPGKNALLSAAYCVIVPFISWAVIRQKPKTNHIVAAFICTAGILISLFAGGGELNKGDVFSVVSAFLFAAHIVSIAKYGSGRDPILMTMLQFLVCAVFSWIAALILKDPSKAIWNATSISAVLYLGIACTAICILFENIGLEYVCSEESSMIMSLESLFSIVFSVIFFKEAITVSTAIGFTFIVRFSMIKPPAMREVQGCFSFK